MSGLDAPDKEHSEVAMRYERDAIEAKESDLQSVFNDLVWTQPVPSESEGYLQREQSALKTFEGKSKRLSEIGTTARFYKSSEEL